MNRTRLAFLILMTVISGLAFWNYRLVKENHRLARALHQIVKNAPVARAPAPGRFQRQISEEKETLEALTARLREAQAANDSHNAPQPLPEELQKRKQTVDNLKKQLENLPHAGTKQQLDEQIRVQQKLVDSHKVKIAQLKKKKTREARNDLSLASAQLEADQKMLQDLKKQHAAAKETPAQAKARVQLEERFDAENEQYQRLKSRHQLKSREIASQKDEIKKLQVEIGKHQNKLRLLEEQAKRPQ